MTAGPPGRVKGLALADLLALCRPVNPHRVALSVEGDMDLTTAERAVLRQVRDFFGEASITSYRLASLAARWPDAHRDAYQAAFESLVRKGLLVQRPGEQMFGITGAGLKAMV